jgi:hypothetical protein
MAEASIGEANDVVPPQKSPTEEEQQGYRPVSADEESMKTSEHNINA